jgi:hypothetical protein
LRYCFSLSRSRDGPQKGAIFAETWNGHAAVYAFVQRQREVVMADILQRLPSEELRAHWRSLMGFERLVLFAILHVALVLSCLALAFLGDAPTVAVLLGLGGSLALIIVFVVSGLQD